MREDARDILNHPWRERICFKETVTINLDVILSFVTVFWIDFKIYVIFIFYLLYILLFLE